LEALALNISLKTDAAQALAADIAAVMGILNQIGKAQ
jgi:hypothetical protein